MRKTIQPKALQAPEIRSADFGNKVSNGLKVKVVSGHNNEFSEYVNKPFSVELWTAWKWTYYVYFLFSYFFIGVTNHQKSTIVKRSSSLSQCCSTAKNSPIGFPAGNRTVHPQSTYI